MVQVKRKAGSGSERDEKKPRSITDFFAKQDSTINSQIKKKETISNEVPDKEAKTETAKDEQTKPLPSQTEKIESPASQPSQKHADLINVSDETSHFSKKHGFDKDKWISGLSDEEHSLLQLEIDTLHITWLAFLHKELTKPYFLNLKRFLKSQSGKTVFPPSQDIYSWSHFTPLPDVKCLILGQDPYHNHNQAHGLAFSVLEPTRPPPSLLNIYKTLKIDFPDFVAPDYKELLKQGKPGGGNLTKWAKNGVLMLNACLTVEAHKANSHAKKGWEQFTEKVIEVAIAYARDHNQQGFVIMAWGTPAHKRVDQFKVQLSKKDVEFCVLRSVHPSPLSARRGFFESQVFKKCNLWLQEKGRLPIVWGLIDGNDVC